MRSAAGRQAGAGGVPQHALQLAAMDGELRHGVARMHAALLAPDLLAEAVDVDQLVRADADRVQRRQQAEGGEFGDGVRQRVDADAERADRVGLLEHDAGDAALVQREGEGEAADAGAGDRGSVMRSAPGGAHERRAWVGQRRDDGEMVGAGNALPRAAPGLGDAARLALVFRAFATADDRVDAAAGRREVDRREAAASAGSSRERRVEAGLDQRR